LGLAALDANVPETPALVEMAHPETSHRATPHSYVAAAQEDRRISWTPAVLGGLDESIHDRGPGHGRHGGPPGVADRSGESGWPGATHHAHILTCGEWKGEST
jgi:hypothetical protein